MKRTIATYITSIAILAAVFSLQAPRTAIAQGYNVEVSPTKVNLNLELGSNYTQTFRIGNFSGADRVFDLYVRDFTVTSEEGAPEFYEDTEIDNSQYSLRKWVTLPFNEVRVADGSVQEVVVRVNVPRDAEPGGHYAALFVQTDTPGDQNSGAAVGAVGRIASLMLVSVPGDVTEGIQLVEITTDKNIYTDTAPLVKLSTLLKNTGNVHGIPTGALFVRGGLNFEDKTVIYNQNQGAVLPGAPERRISESFVIEKEGLIPPMGKFSVELLAKYGSENYEIAGIVDFWVLPLEFMLWVGVGLIVVAFVTWRVVVSFRK